MSIPSTIASEAIQLLEEADWPWSNIHNAFVESRDPERETTENYLSRSPAQISYEELREHRLAGPASMAEREAGLQWLRRRLSASS